MIFCGGAGSALRISWVTVTNMPRREASRSLSRRLLWHNGALLGQVRSQIAGGRNRWAGGLQRSGDQQSIRKGNKATTSPIPRWRQNVADEDGIRRVKPLCGSLERTIALGMHRGRQGGHTCHRDKESFHENKDSVYASPRQCGHGPSPLEYRVWGLGGIIPGGNETGGN
jgi:hypothetical protein